MNPPPSAVRPRHTPSTRVGREKSEASDRARIAMRVVASGAASAAAATRASRRSAASSTRRALLPPPPPPRRRDVVVVVGARRPRQHRGGVALARATPPSDDVASSPDLLEVVEPTLVEPRGGGGGDDDDDDATPSTSASTSGAASDPDPAAAVSTAAALTVLGVEMRPEVAAIVLVYFVQGILGLSRLAKDYFLKDDLHLSPAEASLVLSVSAAPWLVKPVWGFISDSVPLFGYRRKSYLVLCGALGAVAGFGLSAYVTDVPGAVIAFTAGSLSTAFADVVIDSVVVAAARGESQATSGSLQSLCWGSVALGGIASAYFSGALIEERGTRFVFGVTALFPLLIAAAATLVNEKRIVDPSDRGDAPPSPSPSSSSHPGIVDEIKILGGKLWDVGKDRRVWAPTAFVFLWQATPNPGAAMFYFQTEALGFTPEFLGRVALARSVAALVGVGVYNAYLKDVPLKKMFTVSAVLGTCLGLTQLILVAGLNREWGISDQVRSIHWSPYDRVGVVNADP